MAKLIAQISPADLDYIADCFIDDAPQSQYANFEMFWGALLSEDPMIETIAELFLELQQLGYAVETHMGQFPSTPALSEEARKAAAQSNLRLERV